MSTDERRNEKRWVVTRTARDDGSWNARSEYLLVEKHHGLFTWVQHGAHGTKMTWLQAVCTSKLCGVLPPELGEERTHEYDYHWEEQPMSDEPLFGSKLEYEQALRTLKHVDYTQLEKHMLAHAAEEVLDWHMLRACEMFGVTPQRVSPQQRQLAKAYNHMRAYGYDARLHAAKLVAGSATGRLKP